MTKRRAARRWRPMPPRRRHQRPGRTRDPLDLVQQRLTDLALGRLALPPVQARAIDMLVRKTRPDPNLHPDNWTDTDARLLRRLQDVALGRGALTPVELRAIGIVLRKSMPDLKRGAEPWQKPETEWQFMRQLGIQSRDQRTKRKREAHQAKADAARRAGLTQSVVTVAIATGAANDLPSNRPAD